MTVETIERLIPRGTVEAVIGEAHVPEQRVRKLPASLTVRVVVGMTLYSQWSIEAGLAKLVKGLRLLWVDWESPVAQASAISQRR